MLIRMLSISLFFLTIANTYTSFDQLPPVNLPLFADMARYRINTTISIIREKLARGQVQFYKNQIDTKIEQALTKQENLSELRKKYTTKLELLKNKYTQMKKNDPSLIERIFIKEKENEPLFIECAHLANLIAFAQMIEKRRSPRLKRSNVE